MQGKHVVQQGECLSSIAHRFGFYNWRTIYDDPANARLRELRPDPNVLLPGDVVIIPNMRSRRVRCTTGQQHRFHVARELTLFRVLVEVGEPHRYELVVEGETFAGTTDGKSPIEHPIPAAAQSGELHLWPVASANASRPGEVVWRLDLGHIDPHREVSGLQGRLRNLGFYTGGITGDVGPDTVEAVKAFQRAMDLESSGEVDDALCDLVARRHDGVG